MNVEHMINLIWNIIEYGGRLMRIHAPFFETSRIFEALFGLEDAQSMCRSELLRVSICILS